MVAGEHNKVIEVRRRLIYTEVIDPEEVAEDGSIDYDSAASDEQDGSGLVQAYVITGVLELYTMDTTARVHSPEQGSVTTTCG